MSELAIQTVGLSKNYLEKQVLVNCNMHVPYGSIYCLVGQNGAGKTTIFKILMGLAFASMGDAYVLGLNTKSNREQILSQVGGFVNNPVFYDHLSAESNLKIHLEYMGVSDFSRIDWALNLVGLTGVNQQVVSSFSTGMRQRLAVARAVIHHPRLLILDEPINGMDPLGVRQMRDLFQQLVRAGVTILLSSHILAEVEQVAEYIGFLHNGFILEEAKLEDLRARHLGNLEDHFVNIVQKGISI